MSNSLLFDRLILTAHLHSTFPIPLHDSTSYHSLVLQSNHHTEVTVRIYLALTQVRWTFCFLAEFLSDFPGTAISYHHPRFCYRQWDIFVRTVTEEHIIYKFMAMIYDDDDYDKEKCWLLRVQTCSLGIWHIKCYEHCTLKVCVFLEAARKSRYRFARRHDVMNHMNRIIINNAETASSLTKLTFGRFSYFFKKLES